MAFWNRAALTQTQVYVDIFDGFLEQGGADSDAGLCGFGIVVLVRNFLT